MLNRLAFKTALMAVIGGLAPAHAGSGGAPVERLVVGSWNDGDAGGPGGFGQRRPMPTGTGAVRPADGQDQGDLRDVVGSVTPPPPTPAETALRSGMGRFSFCDCGSEDPALPFHAADGFGSEARMRREWAMNLATYRYDLGHPDFGVLAPLAASALAEPRDSVGE